MAEPFIAIPRGADGRIALLATLFAGTSFVALYGGASWLSAHVPWSISLMTPLDREVPFVPSASIVYLSMDLLLGLAPFVLRRPRECIAFALTIAAQSLAGAVVFVLLPVASELPPRVVETGTPIDQTFAIADALNLERNFFPSLHVAFAFTAALAYAPRASPPVRALLFVWASAIAASTMLLHEHYWLDVIAGLGLAVLAVRLVYAPLRSVEGTVLAEIARTSLRHPRYALIGAALYRASAGRFAERRVLRTGYTFLQAIDDILDGDLPVAGEPEEIADALLAAAEGRAPARTELEQLGVAFRRELPADAWPDVRALVEIMKLDRRRVRDRLVLSEPELRAQLGATFTKSVDLMLIAGGARARAADVPSLIEAFAWCSVVRDLDEDLRHGLVNLPRHVVGVFDRADALAREPAVLAWLASERMRAIDMLERADVEIAALEDRSAARVLALFARSIRRYTRRGAASVAPRPGAAPAR